MPGLTEEQRAQARGIAERYEPQTAPLRQQLLAAQQALDAAIATAPVDEGLIRQHAAEVAAASAELAVIRAHVRSEVAALLTPEQRQQQQERQARQEERRERMRERRQNGPGAGQ
jgi:Spy/CpxP family protein refolding chaperone